MVIGDFRGAAWEGTIDRAGESSKNVQLCHQLTRGSTPICPITNRAGVRCEDAQARAERRECINSWPSHLPANVFLSPAKLHKIVLHLPKKKVPGSDGISTAALRHLPRRVMVAINQVFNGILRTGHFPEIWKRGKVMTTLKAGKDPRRAEYLRPIILLLYWPLSHASTNNSTTLPGIREELRTVPGGSAIGYGAGLLKDVAQWPSPQSTGYPTAVSTDKSHRQVPPPFAVSALLSTRYRAPPARSEQEYPQGSCLSPSLNATYTDDIPALRGHLEDWEDDVMLGAVR
ncbi:RNA-directed DNA polymerase from mobile element jockey [Eumeta japonica]|uniref:RNA-directed DNA polymerase from mobile element jockey n=1 Tax=Eumeta variegata TaxID=151549 RepID=A0A4C1XC56_EUMVA|nr:RNA-directed DNA polymerase from mobile element jockey [Eumeta japonica]